MRARSPVRIKAPNHKSDVQASGLTRVKAGDLGFKSPRARHDLIASHARVLARVWLDWDCFTQLLRFVAANMFGITFCLRASIDVIRGPRLI